MIFLRMEANPLARKFFNQKVQNTKKTVMQICIIAACIIGVLVCFLLAYYFNNKPKKEAIINLRDSVAIEINSQLPDKTTFFTQLENVKESDIQISYEKVNTKNIGEYPVSIRLYGKKYESKVIVLDSIAPDLDLKELKIEEGDSYTPQDFVNYCNDNSMQECSLEFYTLATDQDGNKIDYSKYKEVGSYKIEIIATDEANNSTIKETTLTIGNGEQKPPVCKYGSNEYDKDKYLLAVDVTENGCAIDAELYNDDIIYERVSTILDNDTNRLKNEFKKQNGSGNLILNQYPNAIRNKEGKGIVGYTIHMEVSLEKNGEKEVIESYDLDINGKRIYTINKFNLEP